MTDESRKSRMTKRPCFYQLNLRTSAAAGPALTRYCYAAKSVGFPGRRATPPGKAVWSAGNYGRPISSGCQFRARPRKSPRVSPSLGRRDRSRSPDSATVVIVDTTLRDGTFLSVTMHGALERTAAFRKLRPKLIIYRLYSDKVSL